MKESTNELLDKCGAELSVIAPTYWIALTHHRNHKNEQLAFSERTYLEKIYCDKSDYIVIEKSTQCGLSEFLIVTTITKAKNGRSIFYVMPTWELKNRFVKNRFDLTIEYTNEYKKLLKSTIQKASESTSLKHIGKGSIAFLGSNSASSFTEFAADDLIIDELDRCNMENLAMADERLSASKDKRIIKISNPTIEDFGINAEYRQTDKKKWYFRCSNCNKYIHPNFWSQVVKEYEENEYIILDKTWDKSSTKDIKPICHLCYKPYDRFAYGEWVIETKSDKSGYKISKMFSTNMKVKELVDRFEKGTKSDIAMQRFYNGDLGDPYTAKGSQVTYEMLDNCIEDYLMPSSLSTGASVMGIDVGTYLHISINHILPDGRLRAVYRKPVPFSENSEDITEIYNLWKSYNVKMGVIDSGPEMRLARRLCSKIKGMFRWYHAQGKKDAIDLRNKVVTMDRNLLLDDVKECIITNNVILPKNIKMLLPITSKGVSEYYDNMTASTRIFDENKKRYRWVESRPDHFMFAEGYSLLAKRLLLTFTKRKAIKLS